MVAALTTYSRALDEPLWLVPALLLLPDLLVAGYARSNRLGASLYNLAHAYPAPRHSEPWRRSPTVRSSKRSHASGSRTSVWIEPSDTA
jgi:hypothetical protein